MDRAALLADFQSKVDEFAKFQGFIEKTRAQAARFAAAVVEKVLKANIEKRDEVAAAIRPLTSELDGVIAELSGQRQAVESGREGSRLQLQELELRLAIDELTKKDFEDQSAELRAVVEKSDEQVREIDAELGHFRDALANWKQIGDDAGVSTGASGGAPPRPVADDDLVGFEDEDADAFAGEDEPVVEEEDDDEEDEDEIAVEDEDEEADEAFGAVGADDGIRFDAARQTDDLSVVFGDEDEGEGIKLEVGDMDTLVDDDLQAMEAEEEDRPRRAVMLYQEGTAEEQVYPFNGDLMTLGRGRDNDIQVKNDSKVSRYHCKLYRRNGNFYIEDNKSANGTLVNGELVTERRLFGGEEIIIGETFFRFRIMD